MKNVRILHNLFVTPFFLCFLTQHSNAQFQYINPMPGSMYRNPETTILLRPVEEVDSSSLHKKIIITGSKSGKHDYIIRLARDRKSIIIVPEIKFDHDEEVTVSVAKGITTISGNVLEGTVFYFETRRRYTPEELKRIESAKEAEAYEMYGKEYAGEKFGEDAPPAFTLAIDTTKAFNGAAFFGTKHNLPGAIDKFLCILKNDGTYSWTKNVHTDGANFKLDKNGYITYYRIESFKWYMIDSNYNLVDSFQCKNGYELETNYHEFQLLADDHKFLLAYHYETVDLSQYGGLPNATVKFPVIQEQDADDNVVFEWASWDHFQLTDATYDVVFTTGIVDPYHTNAIDLDNDGHLLISSRYLDEITKINHQTGDIIWRMGGENNQFTFVNDPLVPPFSHQHDIRRIVNGNVTLFDNGNLRLPQISYAKEYSLDEENKIATLVWSYHHPPVNGKEVFSLAQGNAQRLPNGNTLVNYAQLSNFNAGLPSATEVTSAGDIAWEITFTENQTYSYRMYKYEWLPCARVTDYTLSAASASPSKQLLSWGAATGAIQYKIQYRIEGSLPWQTLKSFTTTKNAKNLQPNTIYEWRLRTLCAGNTHSAYTAIHTFQTAPMKSVMNNPADHAHVYPNPASESIRLKFTSDKIQDAGVTLLNAYGNEIYYTLYRTQEGVNEIELNISFLPKGIYFVTLQLHEEKTITKFLLQ